MTAAYVVDTHILIWHLQSSTRLSPQARSIWAQVDCGEAIALVPTIVLVEMIYLAEKGRIDEGLLKIAVDRLEEGSENYHVTPLDLAVVEGLSRVPRSVVPDMPDRIIAATALAHGLPLLSRDSSIAQLTEIQVVR